MTATSSSSSSSSNDNSHDDDDDDDDVPVLVKVSPETTEATPLVSSSPPENNHDHRDEVQSEQPSPSAAAAAASQHPQQQVQEPPPLPCPVTILSGFLGSGKTTLIQYILRSPNHGKRIAVIENEYANSREGLSVESLLVRDGSRTNALQDLIELPNGCLCCTVKDSLVVTLEQLLLRSNGSIDAILIECSGLANPGPVAATFWLDAALESQLRLAGIVTVVDAYHIRNQLHDTVEASLQIAYADRILLNKVDLLLPTCTSTTTSPNDTANHVDDHNNSDDPVQAVEDLIRTLHPTAPLQRTTFSAVPDLDWILNAGLATEQPILDVPCSNSDHRTCSSKNHHHQHDPHDHHNTTGPDHVNDNDTTANASSCTVCTGHTLDVSTVSLMVSGTVELTRMHQWLAALLEQQPSQAEEEEREAEVAAAAAAAHHIDHSHDQHQQQIFRIKGILSVRHGPNVATGVDDDDEDRYIDPVTRVDRRRFIVQAVHDLWDIYPASGSGPDTFWDDADNHQNDDSHEYPQQQQQYRTSHLVVIGRHLQGDALQQAFETCRIVGEG